MNEETRTADTAQAPTPGGTKSKLLNKYKWSEVKPPKVWRPTVVGEELVGRYGGRTVRDGKTGQYEVVLIRTTGNAVEQTYIVSGTMILRLIDAAGLKDGAPLRIVWRGHKFAESSGLSYKDYSVLVPAKDDDEEEACGSEKAIEALRETALRELLSHNPDITSETDFSSAGFAVLDEETLCLLLKDRFLLGQPRTVAPR